MLSLLKEFLTSRGRASLVEIAAALGVDPGALRGMLELLERRGYVRRLGSAARCEKCTRCAAGAGEVYEWDGPR